MLTLCGVFVHVCAGKRISQKLLRNCVKFLSIIHDVLKIAPMEYIKQSSDEIDIRGPESKYDSRKINSYPSKVGIVCLSVEFSGVSLLSGCGPIFVCFGQHRQPQCCGKTNGLCVPAAKRLLPRLLRGSYPWQPIVVITCRRCEKVQTRLGTRTVSEFNHKKTTQTRLNVNILCTIVMH